MLLNECLNQKIIVPAKRKLKIDLLETKIGDMNNMFIEVQWKIK